MKRTLCSAVVAFSSVLLLAALPAAAGSLSGTVTDHATVMPVAGVTVLVLDTSGSTVGSATSDEAGFYQVGGLATGTYYLRTQNTFGYVDEIYFDTPCPPQFCYDVTIGNSVGVTSGSATTDIDFALERSITITGQVRAEATTAPIQGATLFLLNAEWIPVAYTDAQGNYAIEGLPAGTYYVVATTTQGYVDELFDNVPCPQGWCSGGDGIMLAAGETAPGVDFDLAVGGSIAGSIEGPGSIHLQDIEVVVVNTSGAEIRGVSDTLGSYTVSGLPAGTYYVRTSNSQGYGDELYDNLPCPDGNCTMTDGTPVSVSTGATVTGIDFTLNGPPPLDVTRDGAGTGTVTSEPAGIDCGADCSQAYPISTAVTLTATPAGGSAFGGWGGACSGTQPTCQLVMDGPKSVTATFTLPPATHDLTVVRSGLGIGLVVSAPAGIDCGADCTETFAAGTPVVLTATPDVGSVLVGWTGGCVGTGLSCNLTMDAAKTVTAEFDLVGEPITWERLIGTAAEGSILRRPSGSGWNAGAVSNRVLASGDGYFEVTLPATPGYAMFGLSHGDTDGGYADIDYAIYTYPPTSALMVYEKGVYRGAFGGYAAGDRLRVSVEGGVVTYRRNGQLLGTSVVAPTYPLLADTSLNSAGTELLDGRIAGTLEDRVVLQATDVFWRNLVRTTVQGTSLVRDATSGWNGGASSAQELVSGDGYTEYRVSSASASLMFGLSRGDTDAGYADIDYALYTYPSTSRLMVYERGTYRANLGTYGVNDVLRVAVEGGLVTYSVNGALLYTSSTPPTYPLLTDTSLYSANASLSNARMGGELREAVQWTRLTGVQVVGDTLTRPVAGGWTAGAISSRRIPTGNGGAEYRVANMSSSVMFGLSHGDADGSYADIDYAIYTYPATGRLMVYEKGSYRGQVGAYAAGDVLRVSVEAGVVSYWRNGGLLYTSLASATYPLVVDVSLYSGVIQEARLFGNLASPIVIEDPAAWTNLVGVTDGGGGTLQRPAGTGWNAGAISTQSLAGDGFVEFTVADAINGLMFGLGNGDVDGGYGDIEYAIYTYPATARLLIYENGAYRTSVGPYVPGDKLRVAVEGGVVRYRRNGALLYSSTVPPTYPLSIDTSLYSPGATVLGAKLGREE
jgi:hypothetical protein